MWQDLRVAWRALAGRPIVHGVLTLVLALGLATAVVLFSIGDALCFRPLRVPEPDRLVEIRLYEKGGDDASARVSRRQAEALERSGVSGLASVGSVFRRGCMVDAGGAATWVSCAEVSAGFFRVVGVAPETGRVDEPTAADQRVSAVVSRDFLARHGLEIGGSPSRAPRLSDWDGALLKATWRPLNIVGVMPAGFRFPGDTELWLLRPAGQHQAMSPERRLVWARLAVGTSAATVGERLVPVAETILGVAQGAAIVQVVPLSEAIVPGAARAVPALLAAAIGITFAAWTQVLVLLAFKLSGSQSDCLVRLALGAGRLRLIRPHLLEGLVVAVGSTVLGVSIAASAHGVVTRAWPGLAGQLVPFAAASVAFAGVLGTAVLIPFAATVFWLTTRTIRRASSGSRPRLTLASGGLFGRAATALSLCIATAFAYLAGVFTTGFISAYFRDPGFDPKGLVQVHLVPDLGRLDDLRAATSPAGLAVWRQVQTELAQIPGVDRLTASTGTPFGSWQVRTIVSVDERDAEARSLVARERYIDRGYFAVLSVPILLGRDFSPALDEGGGSVVVSASLARGLWGTDSAVGRQVRVRDRQHTVVGVCADFLDENLSAPAGPRVYRYSQGTGREMLLRTRGRTRPVLEAARALLQRQYPGWYVNGLDYGEYYWQQTTPERVRAELMGVLAAILTAVSLLGVVAHVGHWVAAHRRPAGVLAALGAPRRAILATLLGPLLRSSVYGVCLGALLGVVGAGLLRSMLPQVAVLAPVALAAAVSLIAVVSVTALVWPARRVLGENPAEMLREP